MAYSNAKLKSSGDRVSPCFRPFWTGKLSDKSLPIQTLLYATKLYENIVQYFPPHYITGFLEVYD
jgi:hypothetical protein